MLTSCCHGSRLISIRFWLTHLKTFVPQASCPLWQTRSGWGRNWVWWLENTLYIRVIFMTWVSLSKKTFFFTFGGEEHYTEKKYTIQSLSMNMYVLRLWLHVSYEKLSIILDHFPIIRVIGFRPLVQMLTRTDMWKIMLSKLFTSLIF